MLFSVASDKGEAWRNDKIDELITKNLTEGKRRCARQIQDKVPITYYIIFGEAEFRVL